MTLNPGESRGLSPPVSAGSDDANPRAGRAGTVSGFGDIARRMTSRTTDLIAIGMICVASLTLGRQVLEWWHAAPPSTGPAQDAAALPAAWEGDRQPIELEFGDLPLSMTRQEVHGTAEAAVDALAGQCSKRVQELQQAWPVRDQAEERLLERIAGLQPVAEEEGVWQVYALDERFPMVAGVRWMAGDGAAAQDEAAGQVRRLVCWGMALPAGDSVWTSYVFQAAGATGQSIAGVPAVPLPPGARRNLSLRDERGGATIGFSGSAVPQEWLTFYDTWFAGLGWQAGAGWSAGPEAWSARFESPDAAAAGRVDIQFARDARGELTGLLHVDSPEVK